MAANNSMKKNVMESLQAQQDLHQKLYTELDIFRDLIHQKEMQIASLESQVQAYKFKLVSLGCKGFDDNDTMEKTVFGETSLDLGPSKSGDFTSYWQQLKRLDERVKELSMSKDLFYVDNSNKEEMTSAVDAIIVEEGRNLLDVDPNGASNISIHDIFEVPQASNSVEFADLSPKPDSIKLNESKNRLNSAFEEVARLGRELEISRILLDESQLNCAYLENCLHEAREEAQTHLCSANRKASEYSTLHESDVKLRGFLKRLQTSVTVSGGVSAFADSLRSLAQSLSNVADEKADDVTADFRVCVNVLADRVGILSKQRAELLERYSKAETRNKLLVKELEEKKEMANKEKISSCRFEVHEIAAFVLKETGHYQAINKECSNYYLSPESVALFTDHLPNLPTYIVGEIVHIERRVVMSPPPMGAEQNRAEAVDLLAKDPITNSVGLNSVLLSNPFGLPVGCGYFQVTMAMLPDTSIHSPASDPAT